MNRVAPLTVGSDVATDAAEGCSRVAGAARQWVLPPRPRHAFDSAGVLGLSAAEAFAKAGVLCCAQPLSGIALRTRTANSACIKPGVMPALAPRLDMDVQ